MGELVYLHDRQKPLTRQERFEIVVISVFAVCCVLFDLESLVIAMIGFVLG